ncbi:MAG: leucine-rich repeat domain-containing protein [Chitinispirillaceae bacterium]|nr:leucine-rich repeat domain-containing protein [Chitinispirillaceae bacterium]
MLNRFLIVVCFCLSLAYSQDSSTTSVPPPPSASYGDDIAVVTAILSKSGMTEVSAQQVAVVEGGRVVSLDLTNTDIAKDGISAIPSEIGQLSELKKFVCNNNSVTEIPDEIGNLSKLEILIFQSNRIEKVTAAIGKCTSLVDLDLRHNQLGEIPAEIGNLKKLARLWLWGNKLTSLNDAVTRITSLREIYLKDNRLTTLPAGIMKMNLTYFDVIGNKICKPDPKLKAWLVKSDKRFKETQKCW